jgi:glycosyltransferase involved in cell wall biosynthesis
MNGKFVAAYVGTHGMAHHLETILEAAEHLRDHPDIHFLMVGDGAERERLQQLAQANQLSNVTFLGQLPKSSMPALWNRVQVSLILLRKSDTFKSVIPSKIFESLAMNKAIVLGVEGESARLLDQSGCGVCIEPEDAAELARTVQALADDRERHQQLSAGGYEFVSEHFDRDRLAQRFVEGMAARIVTLSPPSAVCSDGRRD